MHKPKDADQGSELSLTTYQRNIQAMSLGELLYIALIEPPNPSLLGRLVAEPSLLQPEASANVIALDTASTHGE